MKNSIVVYFSNNGSNRFLAEKIASEINGHKEELKPRIRFHLLLMMGLGLGLKKLHSDLRKYDRVILVGPIWMGQFIYPLRTFVKKYKDQVNELIFVTCCGSSYDMKDDKFGHGLVFKQVEEIMKGKKVSCYAFPITLLLPEDKKEDGKLVMETRLKEETFKGEIAERFNGMIREISL